MLANSTKHVEMTVKICVPNTVELGFKRNFGHPFFGS